MWRRDYNTGEELILLSVDPCGTNPTQPRLHDMPRGQAITGSHYFVKARMILAEIWRKKMEAMKERERTRTMKGSLGNTGKQMSIIRQYDTRGAEWWTEKGVDWIVRLTLGVLVSRLCKA